MKKVKYKKRLKLKSRAKTFLAPKVLGEHGFILGPCDPPILANLLETPAAKSDSSIVDFSFSFKVSIMKIANQKICSPVHFLNGTAWLPVNREAFINNPIHNVLTPCKDAFSRVALIVFLPLPFLYLYLYLDI